MVKISNIFLQGASDGTKGTFYSPIPCGCSLFPLGEAVQRRKRTPRDHKGAVVSQKNNPFRGRMEAPLTPEQYRVTRGAERNRPFQENITTTGRKEPTSAQTAVTACSVRAQSMTPERVAELFRTPVARKRFDPGGPVPRNDQGGSACARCDAHLVTCSRWSSPTGLRYCITP